MRFNSKALGGTALAAIAGAFLLGAPAMAQSTNSYSNTQSSTTNGMSSQTGSMQPLTQVSNPKTTLASATVQDSAGQSVGQVQSVKTTSSGKASSVKVSLTTSKGAGKTVSIKASDLSYDPSSNMLKSTLTSTQIDSMPATQSP